MDIEELKPCPFCGSGVLHKNNPEKMGRTFFVSCGFCDCRGACLPTEQGAIDAWNTRADEFAAMARDAERYRWLREKGSCNEKSSRGALISVDRLRVLVAFRYWVEPVELDAAIDAAMAERNK